MLYVQKIRKGWFVSETYSAPMSKITLSQIYILIVDSMRLLSTNASKLKRLHCPTDLTEKSQCQIEKKSIELHQHLNPNQGRGVVPGGVCMEEAAVRGGGLG